MITSCRILLFLVFLTIVASVSYADMTIYFKDGREIQVLKIVFHGDHAELFRSDGTVLSVAVSTIDLDSSGIPSAAGTYGETRMTRPAPTVQKPGLIANSPLRQAELKDEWENATIVAVARRDVGSIHQGDTVHAYSPDSADSYTSTGTRSKYYWYDDDRQVYWGSDRDEQPVTFDRGYIIIYKKADGTFGKKIIDATGFSDNFETQKPPSSSGPPLHPVPPETITPPAPDVSSRAVEPQPQQQPETTTTEPEPDTLTEQPVVAKEEPKTQKPAGDRNWIPILAIGFVAVAGGAGILFFVLKGRRKAFIDTSSFGQFERDLQDFELEIWLRHGKTMDQLMDICVKKFYQEKPAALNIANRVLKGSPKNFVLPLIAKEANVSAAEAENIYAEFATRIETIRRLINTVCQKKGLQPKSAVPEPAVQQTTQPTVRTVPPPSHPPVASAPVPPPSAPPVSAIEISIPVPEKQALPKKHSNYDLPSYAQNILDQLAFLTDEG